MKLIEIKLNEFSTARKNPSLPLKKNSCENMKWKMIWKKNHHHSTIQPFFDTTKKLNNNEKKWIVIQFGLKYLKRTSLCTWKVHIPFLSTTLQNTAQSRAKKCLFCIQNKKKLSNNYWPNDFEKTKTFWFSSNKYTNLPIFPPI